MKKITFLIIMLVLVCTLTACVNSNLIDRGKYHLFHTIEEEEYLMFLETFDDNKYEIVDISTKNHYYSVFYKDVK